MHIFNRKKKLQTIYNFLLSITIIKMHRSGNVKTILYTNSTTITNSILCEQFELVQSFASHCCGSPRVYVSVSRIQCVLTLCTVLTLLSVTSCTDRPATWFFFLLRCTAKIEEKENVWKECGENGIRTMKLLFCRGGNCYSGCATPSGWRSSFVIRFLRVECNGEPNVRRSCSKRRE